MTQSPASDPSADLPDVFFVQWGAMAARLSMDPVDMVRVSYSEAGVRPGAHNPNGDASGLIQFMPATLMGLGWMHGDSAFRLLTAAEQVPWVERYYAPYAAWATSDALCYVATFLPALGPKASVGGPDYVLCASGGPLAWAYRDNPALDMDQDGAITVADLGARLEAACRGARYDAIAARVRQAQGLEPTG